jgi:hypothetical protein
MRLIVPETRRPSGEFIGRDAGPLVSTRIIFFSKRRSMASFNNFFVDGSLENIAGAKFCRAELLTRRPSSVNRFS